MVTSPEHITLIRCPNITLIPETPKGRGIFATARIPAGTVIDVCPVLVLGVEENREHIEKTSLYHYTYNWPIKTRDGKTEKLQAVIFGLGSMFNHSREQNVAWTRDIDHLIITYRALRDIEVGEELCISYGDHLTFVDADAHTQDKDVAEDGIMTLSNIQV
ncbi:SET domain-containing protein [Rhizodiscina lignyota]|uniref:SET domain-containing protein n=1 Tax=Rhizodiscina lignyota TaxID=1504668 RepID=A0A9P4IJZ1_9PEZI|nr:SET domain-containing protein [Rhizodiscina lignyota]